MSDTASETGDDVLRAAIALAAGDRQKAMRWYATEELQPFGGKTAAELVKAGRNADILRLLESYEAGFLG